MPWYFPWSDSIKKRACRYLLQHYLGHFLKEKLTLDQLSVDLYNGTGVIKDVLLDVWSLNATLDNFNVPVEIVDGFIGSISVSIPWSALISDSTMVEIYNLELTIQPKQRAETAGMKQASSVMLDSMFSSMTTSMQLAQECLKTDQSGGEQQAETAQPFDGLEMFAQTIEAVLTRIKVTFIDTIVRLEHLPKEAKTGAALEIRIDRIEYFDELATDSGSPVDRVTPENKNIYEPAAIAHKNFHFMGVSMYCDEFPECHRTFSRVNSTTASPESPKTMDHDSSFSPPLSPSASVYQSTMQDNASIPTPEGSPPNSDTKESEPIKIALFHGKQELRLKIKQNEELAGPKLELDCILGSVNVHLSPRQVHLLLEIVQGLSTPGLCDDSNVRPRGMMSKPMEARDYEKVEHELQKQLQHGRIEQQHIERIRNVWRDIDDAMTTQSLDDSDEEAYFDLGASHFTLPSMDSSFSSTTTAASGKSTSTTGSTFFNYGAGYARRESPFQSTIPKSARAKQKPSKHKDTLHKLLDDPTAEVTKYRLKISFLSVIILHEDPPATPSDGIDPGQSSWKKLKKMTEDFFGRASGIGTAGGVDLVEIRERFTEACPFDHLGCLSKPVTIEVNQKVSAALYSMHADITVGLAELVECVFDRRGATSSILGFSLPIDNILPDYCELLTFQQNEPAESKGPMFSSMHTGSTPSLRVKIQSMERLQTTRHASSLPRTDVHFELRKCRSEVDITIVDRIQALLNPQPLATPASSNVYRSMNPSLHQSRQSYFSQAIDEAPSGSDKRLDLRVSSQFMVVFVRFPIPDLRTGQGVDRMPWWRRSLRKETLILELSDADFQTVFGDENSISKYELTWRQGHGLFQESPDKPPISLARISADDSCIPEREEGFGWPRIVIKCFPEMHSVLEEDVESEDSATPHDSLNGACQFPKQEASPFSSKKVIYESEELVMPGDRLEMNNFQEKAVNNTRMVIDLSLPNVNAQLPSREFFELLYNRVSNDLLLWEPLAPAPLDIQEPYSMMPGPAWSLDLATQLMQQETTTEKFSICKSGVQYDSSSDSEEDSGQFYSVQEQKLRQRRKQRQEQGHRQSQICVNLTVNKGKLTACAPLMDEDGKPKTDQHGEFVLEIEDGNLFTVVKFNGDPDLRYLCIQAHRTTLYHSGCVDTPTVWPILEPATLVQPSHLEPTIYLSEPGVITKLTGQVGRGGDTMDMLSIAIKIKLDTFRNVKEYQVALGIRGGTLQHRVTPPGQSWFTQMLDLFNVLDFPILGYTQPKVVTELHTHLWSCAIDYRPLYLPLRALVAIETFSVSSNIIAESSMSLLRFIVDDAALYISDKCNANVVDVKRNYVCVMDLGLFELSLRTSGGKDQRYPKLDLRASNNILHIRTCSDSCQALAKLIVYFANDKDLDQSEDKSTEQQDTKVQLRKAHSESSLSDSPHMSQSHLEQVHDMMADAMKESNSDEHNPTSESSSSGSDFEGGPTEVFFFPDENHPTKATAQQKLSPTEQRTPTPSKVITMTSSGSHDSITSSTLSDDTERFSDDDEFCIIDDPGLGIVPRDGEPTVRMLTKNPIEIVDNHFQLPLGKTDQLKAPEHFPAAVYRYTLREMSLVWYMYGGSDFESTPKCNIGASSPQIGAKHRSSGKADHRLGRVGWQARGGPGRDVDTLMELQLTKVRMQHEVFPENTEQASRQIILINEVEIRDRLVSSKINKFLYQYTSEAMPRQSHANMVVIKALHVRPDPGLPTQQECSLKVCLLPLRLNIDQDALFFLRSFVTSISKDSPHSSGTPSTVPESSPSLAKGGSPAPAPVMMVGGSSSSPPEDPQEFLIMFDEIGEEDDEELADGEDMEEEEEEEVPKAQPVFFKSFVFSPDVPIRLDYHGKRVDMEQGTFAGLLVGLAQLNCSVLQLKRLNHRHGLLGFDRLVLYALSEWLKDIKKNQLPSILGGVGPMYSLVQLVQGIRDLFWLPVEQYRKDGRIVRGLQRGAHSFTTSTAMAALELTNRLVQTVQYAAELAYDMVSPGPSVRHKKHYQRQRRAAQPADIREGVSNAYNVVKEGIYGTAHNIVKVAVEEHEHKGVSGAVGGVLRQIPPTMLQPVILATEATSNVLGGMRNQLRPDRKREDEDKWKPEDN